MQKFSLRKSDNDYGDGRLFSSDIGQIVSIIIKSDVQMYFIVSYSDINRDLTTLIIIEINLRLDRNW